MTKVLFLLSAVVMMVAGVFAYKNRDAFIATRKERANNVDAIEKVNKELRTMDTAVKSVKDSITTASAEVSTENERVNVAQLKLKNTVADGERLTKEVAAAQQKIEEYKLKLKDIPPNFNLETIAEDVNKLKQNIAQLEDSARAIGEQVAVKEGEVKKTQAKLDAIFEKIESRKKLFERNSMSATIVAVNNDWGFVVIDGGENKGITVDTKLLVTRGQDTIGRLNIVDVNGNRTVANIDMKSVRAGTAVAPGDRVILETLYQ